MTGEEVTRADERMVPRDDLADEFPDGVPVWAIDLPPDELREVMRMRREGFTMLGHDPAEDDLDRLDLH